MQFLKQMALSIVPVSVLEGVYWELRDPHSMPILSVPYTIDVHVF